MAYYIVLDDNEAGVPPRPFIRNGLPGTVPIFNNARKKQRVSLSRSWMRFVEKINKMSGGYDYQFMKKGGLKNAVGWHNVGKPNIVEQLTCSGNIVDVTRIDGQRAYIRCFYNTDKPPAPYICVPGKLDPLVQLLTTQYKNKLDITTNGHYPQILIIATSRKQELWIDKRNLRRL